MLQYRVRGFICISSKLSSVKLSFTRRKPEVQSGRAVATMTIDNTISWQSSAIVIFVGKMQLNSS